jgi:hypothetical protein
MQTGVLLPISGSENVNTGNSAEVGAPGAEQMSAKRRSRAGSWRTGEMAETRGQALALSTAAPPDP